MGFYTMQERDGCGVDRSWNNQKYQERTDWNSILGLNWILGLCKSVPKHRICQEISWSQENISVRQFHYQVRYW